MLKRTGRASEIAKLPLAALLVMVLLSGGAVQALAQTLAAGTGPAPRGTIAAIGNDAALRSAEDGLPDAPGVQVNGQKAGRSISGTATDANAAEIAGAEVVLSKVEDLQFERKLTTDAAGHFSFSDVGPGRYELTITAIGFATWVSKEFVVQAGESYEMPDVTLRVALTTTEVEVSFTRYDLAQEQLKAQEKQRVLGIFPNFYVSYVWNAVPLTAGQKFQLALREQGDPEAFAGAAFAAGLEMWLGDYRGYGEGAKGFFTRMGAAYGDGFNSSLIAGAILPSLLHQDPRYFYKGTGSKRSRTLYALSTVVICKGDNGRWQPNYSNVMGNFAAGGISNAYYPAGDKGATLTVVNTSIGLGVSAVGNIFQEFFIKKISTGVKP